MAVIEAEITLSSVAFVEAAACEEMVGEGGPMVYEAFTGSLAALAAVALSLATRDRITLEGVTIVYVADTCSGGEASFWRRKSSRNSFPAVGAALADGTRSLDAVPNVTVVTLSFWD